MNDAKKDGGAIKWIGNQPRILEDNFYQLNKAIYGLEIGSYPVRLGFEIYEKNDSTIKKMIHSSISSLQPGRLKNISVGNEIQYILVFSILDNYGKIVTSVAG